MAIHITHLDIGIFGVERIIDALIASFGTALHQLAMQVKHVLCPRLLVQIIDILRDDLHIELVLEGGHEFVAFVGFAVLELATQHIVEVEANLGLTEPGIVGTHLFHTVVFPKSVTIAEGRYSALGAHAGTGQKYDSFHDNKLLIVNY